MACAKIQLRGYVVLNNYKGIEEPKPRGDGNEEVTGNESPRVQSSRMLTRVAAPMRRGFTRRSTYSASCLRKNIPVRNPTMPRLVERI